MVRTQIQLTEEQARRLRRLAAEREVSIAELVRVGVESVLERAERRDRWSRLRGVIGAFRDAKGAADVSVRHDRYLSEILGRGHGLR